MFTGLHLIHLCIALLFLTIALRTAHEPVLGPRQFRTIEAAACFWHLIDLLWIVLFPLLYLMR
jgi:nitric oxide reductase NorE protein